MRKPLLLALFWIGFLWSGVLVSARPPVQVVTPLFAVLLVVTALLGLTTAGPTGFAQVLRDAFASDPEAIPRERRRSGARTLRFLGQASLGIGVLGYFSSAAVAASYVWSSGGQADVTELVAMVPSFFSGPLQGFLAKAFLFDLLAEGLEAEGSGEEPVPRTDPSPSDE